MYKKVVLLLCSHIIIKLTHSIRTESISQCLQLRGGPGLSKTHFMFWPKQVPVNYQQSENNINKAAQASSCGREQLIINMRQFACFKTDMISWLVAGETGVTFLELPSQLKTEYSAHVKVDSEDRADGEEVVFLYPDLVSCVIGTFSHGKLTGGHFGHVTGLLLFDKVGLFVFIRFSLEISQKA